MARWSKPSKTGKSRLATSWHVRGTFELWLLSCFRVGSSVGKSQHFIVSEKSLKAFESLEMSWTQVWIWYSRGCTVTMPDPIKCSRVGSLFTTVPVTTRLSTVQPMTNLEPCLQCFDLPTVGPLAGTWNVRPSLVDLIAWTPQRCKTFWYIYLKSELVWVYWSILNLVRYCSNPDWDWIVWGCTTFIYIYICSCPHTCTHKFTWARPQAHVGWCSQRSH